MKKIFDDKWHKFHKNRIRNQKLCRVLDKEYDNEITFWDDEIIDILRTSIDKIFKRYGHTMNSIDLDSIIVDGIERFDKHFNSKKSFSAFNYIMTIMKSYLYRSTPVTVKNPLADFKIISI